MSEGAQAWQLDQGARRSALTIARTASFAPTDRNISFFHSEMSKSSLSSGGQNEWWEVKSRDHCGGQYVMREGNIFRCVWTFVICLLLVYTGTYFLYRITFIEFHIPEPLDADSNAFRILDEVMSALFWVDLVLNFFFTYRDHQGVEIDSMRLIATNYLTGYFAINLIACTPEIIVEEIFDAITDSDRGISETSFTGSAGIARISRLQRVSRLARLTRLARIAKIATFNIKDPNWRWLWHLRGIRVLNSGVGLIWVVHLLACGWYLCASLHHDPNETWVARRAVDAAGDTSLLSSKPEDQWLHSFYFILTVFTTVGFGDMSAVTNGEIIYVCFTQMMGAVVHSIIISEVINIVTSVDKTAAFVSKQTELVEGFAEHTELDETSQKLMTAWVAFSAKGWASNRYDREQMKQLITDKCMPRSLLGRLPNSLFGGKLVRNSFLSIRGRAIGDVPPRLPLLLALAAHRSDFEAGELVYQMHDYAINVFLVLSGTFADIARPTPEGGRDEGCHAVVFPGEAMMVLNVGVAGGAGGSNSGSAVVATSSSAHTPSAGGLTLVRPADINATPTASAARDLGPQSTHLFPYRLYSCNSYFGLAEVIDSQQRCSTVRCESDGGGSALVLQKPDLYRLMEEFPQFAMAWRSQARRRELLRLRLRARLTSGMTHRRLAAARIQSAVRAFLAERQHGPRSVKSRSGTTELAQEQQWAVRLQRRRSRVEEFERSCGSWPAEKSGLTANSNPDVRRLALASETYAREVRDLRAGMDAMRADFATLRADLRAMVRGSYKEVEGLSPAKKLASASGSYPSLQTSAYSSGVHGAS
mmetsp:Transcript_127629/g.330840  ORF Transcript_127629/g.330840 Transcript_127629/m.330840 type:complete len:817 (-) Transcript_127629:41-2491(-)